MEPLVDPARISRATFVDRPSQFVARCRRGDGRLIRAFLPNPGRMRELLLPGVILYLAPAPAARKQGRPARRTRYTVLAVERDGAPIFLHTHLNNRVARSLIEHGRVPGLEGARVLDAEVTVGHSRFDFLLSHRSRDVYLEVKSCTLYGNRVAMFPDAVTERGRRHLLELAQMRRHRVRSIVLFVVQTADVDWFMPDYHTDLAFSQTMLEVQGDLRILPVAVQWRPDLTLHEDTRVLDIPWAHLRREVGDQGSYLLILRLRRARRLQVGHLGSLLLSAGYHVYVGSAMRNLTSRVARHLRRRKTLHWHIDHLRKVADTVTALPIRSSRRQECDLAAAVAGLLEPGPAGFGSSDCDCPTHLYHHPRDPLDDPAFHVLLQQFRMAHPRDGG